MPGRATVRDKRAFADLAMAIDGTRDRVESGSGASKVKQGSTHSPLRVTFVVFKFVLGTGMLSMPRAVADTGAVLFPALLLAFAATTWISCSMLAYALDVAGRPLNMAQLGQVALGRRGFWFVAIVGGLDCWGAAMAYWRAIAGILATLQLPLFGANFHVDERLIIALVALAVFPLTLLRRMEPLGLIAMVASLALFAFAATVVVDASIGPSAVALPAVAKSAMGAGTTPIALGLALGNAAFAFDCQVTVFANYRALNRPAGAKRGAMRIALLIALGGSFVMYALVGVAGYLRYGNAVHGNVLTEMVFDGPAATLLIALKWLVVIAAMVDIPLMSFEVAALLQDHLLGHSMASNVAVNFAFVFSSAAVAMLFPSMFVAFAFVGATTATALGAIIPPAIFLATTRAVHGRGCCCCRRAADERGNALPRGDVDNSAERGGARLGAAAPAALIAAGLLDVRDALVARRLAETPQPLRAFASAANLRAALSRVVHCRCYTSSRLRVSAVGEMVVECAESCGGATLTDVTTPAVPPAPGAVAMCSAWVLLACGCVGLPTLLVLTALGGM